MLQKLILFFSLLIVFQGCKKQATTNSLSASILGTWELRTVTDENGKKTIYQPGNGILLIFSSTDCEMHYGSWSSHTPYRIDKATNKIIFNKGVDIVSIGEESGNFLFIEGYTGVFLTHSIYQKIK